MTLSQQGSARAPQKRDLEEKTVEVCGRAAVEKSSQISPKTSIYIGGRGGALHWGSRSPKGVGRAKGGRSPPQTESYLVW